MNAQYRSRVLRHFRDQQVRFAPHDQKLIQADRAEKLLQEVDPRQTYTYEYLCYRLTDYRPNQFPHAAISGEDAQHDLRLLVEDLTAAAKVAAKDMPEPVLTVDELSKRYRVSTKTISRWRDHGLVGRRFVFDGRSRVGFLQSSVERFVRNNEERIRRGAQFSKLSDEEKAEIIHEARVLAQEGALLAEVSRQIAQRMGRSAETIRYTLRQFDKEHPDLAIFAERAGPLAPEAKRKIFQQYRRGTSVEELARQHGRSRQVIHRAINEVRAERIMNLPLEYIPHPSFSQPGIEETILAEMPAAPEARAARPPAGLPPYLASLYEVPLLTAEQEQHLFRKFNFLKYQAAELRKEMAPEGKLEPQRIRGPLLDKIEKLYEQVVAVKNELLRRNLRLVVSIAKRHVGARDNFFELVSDGNMSLIRAVEKFDFSRGNKFSTYATWALMKNFARSIPDEQKQRERFRTSQEEAFELAADPRSDALAQESAQAKREVTVQKAMQWLDPREQQIIISRYGLERGTEPRTLAEVGDELKITKERVRQLETRALEKLRRAAIEHALEMPET